MKKKGFLFFTIVILMLTFSLTLSACNGNNDAARVNFIIDDKVEATAQAVDGAELPSISAKEGYTLSAWYFDNEFKEEFSFEKLREKGLTGEVSVYAKWILNKYTIAFEENGGSPVEDITADFGASISKPKSPTKEDYTFGGWFSDDALLNEFVFDTMPSAGSTVFAKWDINQYTIVFEENGGSPVADITADFGATVIKPSDPTREGFVFGGWFSNTEYLNEFVFNTMPSGGARVYAKWNTIYSITYYLNDGVNSVANPNTYTIEDAVNFASPTKTGYTFIGWFDENVGGNQISGLALGSTGHLNLYARWSVNEYKISFEENGGSGVDDITADFGATLIQPSDPAKDGYTFGGWFSDNDTFLNKLVFDTMPANGATAYAKWIPKQYTIVFEENEGSFVADITAEFGDIISEPNEPTKKDFVFKGWFVDNGTFQNKFVFDTMPLNGATLYAKWSVPSTKNLAYTYNSSLDGYEVSIGSASTNAPIVVDDTYDDGVNGQKPVKGVADNAFKDMQGLGGITLPDGLIRIGEYAFAGCIRFRQINIPNSVTSIGNGAFYDCKLLENLTIPNGVTSVGDFALYNCRVLREIIIPDSVVGIGEKAFWGCIALFRVKIGQKVESIGSSAFKGCEMLRGIVLPEGVSSIGSYAFADTLLTEIIIPDSVTSIGESVFQGCVKLSNATIGSGITVIPTFMFYGCSNLVSVIIPSGVKNIGAYAFYECGGLTSIVIPDGVENIGQSAFLGCRGIMSITIPKSVTSIGERAFANCGGLATIVVAEGNEVYQSVANCLIERATKALILGCKGSYIPTDGRVTSIASDAFYGCSGLMSVDIPDSVMSIGDNAFQNCSGLTSINIPNSVTSIGSNAFEDCSELRSINIHGGITAIANFTFKNCSRLSSVTFSGNNLKTIGAEAFYGTALVNITIPNSVTSIGNSAFYASKLTRISIPRSVTSLGEYAFAHCSELSEVTIGSAITIGSGIAEIKEGTFSNCAKLTIINYNGTQAEWDAMPKVEGWDFASENYTLNCEVGYI